MIAVWTHSLAAFAFGALLLWRLVAGARQPGHKLLLAGFAVTACWAWLVAIHFSPAVVSYAETARNFVWVGLLFSLYSSGTEEDGRLHGVKLVYAAVAAALALQLVLDTVLLGAHDATIVDTSRMLRLTAVAGCLVLVHNLYGQASAASRSSIGYAMLALVVMWGYDLNFYTVAYLGRGMATELGQWRGAAVALTAPLFAMAARRESDWRIKLSRAATFQSLSLLAICAYFAVMAIIATALKGTELEWSRFLSAVLIAGLTVAAMVLVPSPRARAWAKVKIAKHFFEHRYDYRTEWLRFTETLGTSGAAAGAPLRERIVKALADVLESPGGLLLESDGSTVIAASWQWPGPGVRSKEFSAFWEAVSASGRIIEFDAIRNGYAGPQERSVPIPEKLLEDATVWVGIPLIHDEKVAGFLLLAAPEYRRPLDWEDFDLLRTAARQAASSLAEAQTQRALVDAQRFEEFNRRFAFILHDIKNLVSQLSLVARNAERHADKAEFRADMIATLKASISKMNDMLARLSPQASARHHRLDSQVVRDIASAAIAARRAGHDVRLLGDASQLVMADGRGLEQALGHLIQNAVEASPPAKPVTVRVARSGEQVAISVTDKGSGMDPDFVREGLFQPFVSTKASGFGVGAFEARSLIVAMGGRLSVESERGRGTTFTIHLPAAEAPATDQRKIA